MCTSWTSTAQWQLAADHFAMIGTKEEHYEVDQKHQHGTECSVIEDLLADEALMFTEHCRPQCVPA